MSLRLLVSDLLSHPGQSRDETADLPLRFVVGDASVDDQVGIEIHIRSLSGGVLVKGRAVTAADLTCVRCLTTWSEPVEAPLEAVFRIHPDDEEDEFPVAEGGWIDLEPLIHDEVSLALPIRPVCRPDCAGLCQTCGADLNNGPCAGHGEVSDSPFAALKQIFET